LLDEGSIGCEYKSRHQGHFLYLKNTILIFCERGAH